MIKRILRSPYFSLFSFAISLGFAAYFYTASRPVSEITYSLATEHIFTESEQFPISSQYNETEFQGGHLTSLKYVFWNSGNNPLNPGDIRQNLAIRNSDVKFVDAKITDYAPSFSDFSFSITTDNINFGWKFFDPGAFF